MYKENNLTPAEQALESALAQLKPVANTLNRDILMFNAGRASTGRKLPWQMLSSLLTVLLLFSVFSRSGMNENVKLPSNSRQNQFQAVKMPYRPVDTELPNSVAYPRLRENIIRYGLDALKLQQSQRYSEPSRNRKQWLDSMLSS